MTRFHTRGYRISHHYCFHGCGHIPKFHLSTNSFFPELLLRNNHLTLHLMTNVLSLYHTDLFYNVFYSSSFFSNFSIAKFSLLSLVLLSDDNTCSMAAGHIQ